MRTYKTNLTKRTFELVAEAINSTSLREDARQEVADALARRLAETNPQFDRSRFLKACGCSAA